MISSPLEALFSSFAESSDQKNLGVMGIVVFGRSYSEAPSFHGALSCEPRKSPLRPGFCLSPLPFSSTGFHLGPAQVWLPVQPDAGIPQCSGMVQELGINMLLALRSDEDDDLSAWLQAEASGTRNEEGVGSLEDQHAALNMKGKERFYDHQGHFSKRGTSACSGLKQVNAKRQPDKSLLR